MGTDFHVVDLKQEGESLTVRWSQGPGDKPRAVEEATRASMEQQVAALVEAERQGGAVGLGVAQRRLGEAVYLLLDGPERALQRRVEEAKREGQPLHLVVRLSSTDSRALARHPCLGWQLQLLTAPGAAMEGPLALREDTTLVVQLGEAQPAPAEELAGGRLQVLFMAYAPRGTRPELDYEAEEERILSKLEPFVEQKRLVVRVAEEGSLRELRRRLMRRAYDVVHLSLWMYDLGE